MLSQRRAIFCRYFSATKISVNRARSASFIAAILLRRVAARARLLRARTSNELIPQLVEIDSLVENATP